MVDTLTQNEEHMKYGIDPNLQNDVNNNISRHGRHPAIKFGKHGVWLMPYVINWHATGLTFFTKQLAKQLLIIIAYMKYDLVILMSTLN